MAIFLVCGLIVLPSSPSILIIIGKVNFPSSHAFLYVPLILRAPTWYVHGSQQHAVFLSTNRAQCYFISVIGREPVGKSLITA